MISDSRGNCAFAHQMMRNFYGEKNLSFRMISAGGSAPLHWLDSKKRFVSPYGLDMEGSSEKAPETFPKALKIGKTTTPYLSNLLKEEAKKSDKFTTIINMGTNDSDIKRLKNDATLVIKEVHKNNASCVWVSPPHAQGFSVSRIEAQTNAIKQAILDAGPGKNGEDCKLINSLEITHYPYTRMSKGIDLVHYCWNSQLIELGHQWANRAYETIKETIEE